MKKVLKGILLCLCIFLMCKTTSYAGYRNYIMPEEIDGVPVDIRSATNLIGDEYNICPELLQAIAYRESRYQVDAINGVHYGLCQINVKTHADRIASYGWTDADMLDYYKNLTIAADYLKELFDAYEDVGIVLCIYSGNWKSVPDYKEYGFYCPYVKAVLDLSYELEDIHQKHFIKYGG